jgi:hypothetical protein
MTIPDRIIAGWRYLFDKLVGPVIMLLLTVIVVVLLGYVPQFRFLENRVATLQSEIDKRLIELGKIETKMTAVSGKVDDINAAAKITDDQWARLNKAVVFIKDEPKTLEALARIAEVARVLESLEVQVAQLGRIGHASLAAIKLNETKGQQKRDEILDEQARGYDGFVKEVVALQGQAAIPKTVKAVAR